MFCQFTKKKEFKYLKYLKYLYLKYNLYTFKRALLPQLAFSVFPLDSVQIWKKNPCYSVTDKGVI